MALTGWYSSASIDCFRTCEMPWRSSDRRPSFAGTVLVQSLLGLEVKAATGKTDGAA